jgi:hypothetical protein
MPLALTDSQLDAVFDAARPLQPRDRSRFLKDVAIALAGCPDPGDGTVFKVCRQIQGRYFDPPLLAGGDQSKYR